MNVLSIQSIFFCLHAILREYQQVSWHFFMEYTTKDARKVNNID